MEKNMKRLFLIMWFAALLILSACFDDGGSSSGDSTGDPVVFAGKIEKGALQKGANITASEWSATDGYSGKTYASETFDDKGGYEISSSGLQGLLDIKADGFFINENTNTVENTRIILSGLADSEASGGNINIITHIIKQRVIKLIKEEGKTFAEASNQAVSELYSGLGWEPENPLNTNISTNAKLLFLSAAVCKNRNVNAVSALLTQLTNDMVDGVVDLSVLNNSFSLVNVDEVTANITAMYGQCPEIGSVKSDILTLKGIVDATVRTVNIQPVRTCEFYMFNGSTLYGYYDDDIRTIVITYNQSYLLVDSVGAITVQDFFSITDAGVKTLYFKTKYDFESFSRYFKQVGTVVTELESLPNKPLAVEQTVATADFRTYRSFDGPLPVTTVEATLYDGATQRGVLTGYYIASNWQGRGKGIFTTWNSNGNNVWLSADATTALTSTMIVNTIQGITQIW